MSERNDDFDMDDIFSGIHELVNKREVTPAFDAEKSTIEDRGVYVAKFSRQFVSSLHSLVYRNSNPLEIAPQVRREFLGYKTLTADKLRKSQDFDLADIVDSLSLADAANGAADLIENSERHLADYMPGESRYKLLESEIQRLEILARACLEAKDLR